MCGWEARDLHDLLEGRWARGGPERFESERPLLGDLDGLDRPSTRVRIPAASGHTGVEVAELIDLVRGDQQDERIWRGVRSVTAQGAAAEVEFNRAIDPELRKFLPCLPDVDVGRRGP